MITYGVEGLSTVAILQRSKMWIFLPLTVDFTGGLYPCPDDTFIRLYFMFYLKNDWHLILLHRIAALPQNTDLSMVYTYYAIFK